MKEIKMNKIIVVAYLSLFDGVIQQKLVPARSGLEAMNRFLNTSYTTEDELYQYCYDCDSFISYLEL